MERPALTSLGAAPSNDRVDSLSMGKLNEKDKVEYTEERMKKEGDRDI